MQVSYRRCVLTAGTDTINNGINQFILVLKRANYIVPSRANRSFPLLPGRVGRAVVTAVSRDAPGDSAVWLRDPGSRSRPPCDSLPSSTASSTQLCVGSDL